MENLPVELIIPLVIKLIVGLTFLAYMCYFFTKEMYFEMMVMFGFMVLILRG